MKISTQRFRALDKLESKLKLPAQLIALSKFFTRHALSVMNGAGIEETSKLNGFIFSLSKRQIARAFDCGESTIQRWTILAVAIGLITRLSEKEAEGISEYRGANGIGIQQYNLERINIRKVEQNWKRWKNSGVSFRKISRKTIREIFPVDKIYKHPEAYSHKLREERKNNVGIQATEEDLLVHRNNRKIRLRLRELQINQDGYWSPSKRKIIAPLRINEEEYETNTKRLKDLLDRIIFYDEIKGLGVELETVLRPFGYIEITPEILNILMQIQIIEHDEATDYYIPQEVPEKIANQILGIAA